MATSAALVAAVAPWQGLYGVARVYTGKKNAKKMMKLVHELRAGEIDDQWLGAAVAALGDVDQDGLADLIVGAPAGMENGEFSGRVHVRSGSTGAVRLEHAGEYAYHRFGVALDGVGDIDLDLDGVPDFAVGAPRTGFAGGESGSVYVFSGSDGSLVRRIDGASEFAHFGGAVRLAGDVNEDGRPDMIASAVDEGWLGVVYARTARPSSVGRRRRAWYRGGMNPDDGDRMGRRQFVQRGTLALIAPLIVPRHVPGGEARDVPNARDGEDALDDALERVEARTPGTSRGLSSHATMAVEALLELGHADRIGEWMDQNDERLIALPGPGERIDPDRWRAALGVRPGAGTWEAQNPRFGDWCVFFTERLAEARWQEVLDTWAARLAPGLSGAATHGVIRTAHAVRALARRASPVRLRELARGLAYWASSYEELPAQPRNGARVATCAEAIARVPLYFEQHGTAPPGPNIVAGLRGVRSLDAFADVRDLLAVPADPADPADVAAALSDLSRSFARLYLRHGTRHDAIGFVHAVTGPCALRRIAPHVRPETAVAALPYAWQAAAAILAAYGRAGDPEPEVEPSHSPNELAARAAENGDPHAIKLTEVLLAEHAISPDPVYLAAAADVVARL